MNTDKGIYLIMLLGFVPLIFATLLQLPWFMFLALPHVVLAFLLID